VSRKGPAMHRQARARALDVGDVVAVPLPNGRYGAFCVIDVNEGARRFFVVDGFWDKVPTAAAVARLRPMKLPFGQRDTLHGDDWKGWFDGRIPTDFVTLRRARLSASLQALAVPEGTMIFQDADHFRTYLYRQWCWLHDREALEAEWAADRARYEREQVARAAARKATNSLPRMLRERPFARWREHWPPRAVRAVHAAFRTATEELIALGARAPRRSKEAVFRRLMDALNALYDREGCIETEEATALVERIEELARLVGLNNDDERLTGQRDW